MALFVVRVWLPDRPGALGAVASRVGALRADVVGIEVLEHGAGRAIDELLIDLEDASLVELLVSEIGQVDGADVEHVRPAGPSDGDRGVAGMRVASSLARAETHDDVRHRLCHDARDLFDASWVALVEAATGELVAVGGGLDLPSREWLAAFVIGSKIGEGSFAAVDELARVEVPSAGLEVVVSRAHIPLRQVEFDMLICLAEIAGARISQLGVDAL